VNQSLQAKTKLSQWEALTLESLRAKGWSNEQIIQGAATGELPTDDVESKFQFDYSILADLAKIQPQAFKSAVLEGYNIKYNTIRGIHSWILIALQKEGSLILESGNEAVKAVLTEAEAARLRDVLSFGWQLNAVSDSEQSGSMQSDSEQSGSMQSHSERSVREQLLDEQQQAHVTYEVKLSQTV
jgi:hypothetical protein